MSVFKGDYMGFTYNGVHSSSLGIVRVSDGSRYTENLLPNFQDKTVQIPGGDGTYYFNSFYTQNKITLQIAFDNMTEKQLKDFKLIFGDKKPHTLKFDETPYKSYMAKVTGSSILKYIPFNSEEGKRIYKGEGEIQLVCYQPYAICSGRLRDLDSWEKNSENLQEWNGAANLISFSKNSIDVLKDSKIKIYNPGFKESDPILTFNIGQSDKFYGAKFYIDDSESQILEFATCSPKRSFIESNEVVDCAITFNSKTKLIEGWRENEIAGIKFREKSGNIYNEFIINGDFLKIPITIHNRPNREEDNLSKMSIQILPLPGQTKSLAEQFESIDYNYYYF